MMVVSGLVLVLNTVLSLVVGIRLLRVPGSRQHRPERLLAMYFLLGAFVGNITSSLAYLGWSNPSLGIPLAATTVLNAISLAGSTLGTAGVYLFTAQTFHSGEDRHHVLAQRSARGLIAFMVACWLSEGLIEGFGIRIEAGPVHWVGFTVRVASFGWVAVESLRWYATSRRRLRLGLADALVTNRFLLWGVWSIATGMLLASELLARVLYFLAAGNDALTAHSVATIAQPLIVITIAITGVLGSVTMTMLFLTFFPTAAFRRWVERSAPAPTHLS